MKLGGKITFEIVSFSNVAEHVRRKAEMKCELEI